MLEIKALGLPHVLELWLGLSKGMFSVNYFTPTNAVFVSVEFNGYHKAAIRLR